ncbi:DUF7541 family protein [Halopiger djelfimassiliensis]|uniref:DUF7541 family protein n=1 Tax=Halopiger djelfimassiliensis TaxID=1293047 RepID=UPI00067826DA|nr:hypothetical protein [Halopiger djelfimassiliensis]
MADRSSSTSSATAASQPTTSSPWPVLVAVGLAASEVGIVVDLFPVAVVGLVVFAASVTGIVAESNRFGNPRSFAYGFGLLFVLGGTALYAVGTGLVTLAPLEGLVGLASRGSAIAVAGLVTILGAATSQYR